MNPETRLGRLAGSLAAGAFAIATAVAVPAAPVGAAGSQTVDASVTCEQNGTHTVVFTVTNDIGEGQLSNLQGIVNGSNPEPVTFRATSMNPGDRTTASVTGLPGGTFGTHAAQLALQVTFNTTTHTYANNLAVIIGGGCPGTIQASEAAVCDNSTGTAGPWRLTMNGTNPYDTGPFNPQGLLTAFDGPTQVRQESLAYSPNPVSAHERTSATISLAAPPNPWTIQMNLAIGEEGDGRRLTLPSGPCVRDEVRSPIPQPTTVTATTPTTATPSAPAVDASPRFTG